jgi:SRSO17 transposase
MTEQQIEALAPALADFLEHYLFCCGYTPTFAHLGVYCRGLLSNLERKTAEPIALAAGVPVRTLQEFLRDHAWDHDRVRDLLQRHVAATLTALPHDDIGSLGIIDETGTAKKGTKTPGVQRQHCGELGKTDNCIVTVHLGVSRGRYKTLVDRDLFLPEAWSADRDRCRAAAIPERIVHRPKWQIALEQIDRAKGNGIVLDWLTFDEGYGACPEFLLALDGWYLRFVAEVPRSLRCFAVREPPAATSSWAEDLVRHSPAFVQKPWQTFELSRQTLGEQCWQAKAARVWLSVENKPCEEQWWLVWARNERTGEEKYWLSNAPEETPLRLLLVVAFSRWNVEHAIRVSKSELGLRHFEGRSYVALMRHLTLCLLMLTFVAEQAEQLREKKSGSDSGAGVLLSEVVVLEVVGETAWQQHLAVHGEGRSIPSAPQPRGAIVQAAQAKRPPRRLQPRAATAAQTQTPPATNPLTQLPAHATVAL